MLFRATLKQGWSGGVSYTVYEQLPFHMEKKNTSPAKQNRMPGGLHRSSRHDNNITLAAVLLHVQPFQSKTAKEECLHTQRNETVELYSTGWWLNIFTNSKHTIMIVNDLLNGQQKKIVIIIIIIIIKCHHCPSNHTQMLFTLNNRVKNR